MENENTKKMSLLKPYTNYDKIKDMSLDEMTDFFNHIIATCVTGDCEGCPFKGFCYFGSKQWLESEATI